MYIGPQGIVHGTTITMLNAGRRYLGLPADERRSAGRLFVTSGLGGMSGAQAKAAVIAGAIGVIAEINPAARRASATTQGWVEEVDDRPRPAAAAHRARAPRRKRAAVPRPTWATSWTCGSGSPPPASRWTSARDQTSPAQPLHRRLLPGRADASSRANAHDGRPTRRASRERVQASLRRQVAAINALRRRAACTSGTTATPSCSRRARAGADVARADGALPLPVATSRTSWGRCASTTASGRSAGSAPAATRRDLRDDRPHRRRGPREHGRRGAAARRASRCWTTCAGSAQARAQPAGGRLAGAHPLRRRARGACAIAAAFNAAIRDGRIAAPVVLGRDHHDVSGTDSPYRETANIRDGSHVHAPTWPCRTSSATRFRGATWV